MKNDILDQAHGGVSPELEPGRLTIDCDEGKHGDCPGWGETIFKVPRRRVSCTCPCHEAPVLDDDWPFDDDPPDPL